MADSIINRLSQEKPTHKHIPWFWMTSRYFIDTVEPKKIITDVDSYIMSQNKSTRDKLNSLNIKFNSIEHVSNYIKAILNGEI